MNWLPKNDKVQLSLIRANINKDQNPDQMQTDSKVRSRIQTVDVLRNNYKLLRGTDGRKDGRPDGMTDG